MKTSRISLSSTFALVVLAISIQAFAADKSAEGNTRTKPGMAEVPKPFIQPPSTLTALEVTEVPGTPLARAVKVQWDGHKDLNAHCKFDVDFGNGTVVSGFSSYQVPAFRIGAIYSTTGTFTISVTPSDAANDKCIKGTGANSKKVTIQ
jgi:hypothetical protein